MWNRKKEEKKTIGGIESARLVIEDVNTESRSRQVFSVVLYM